MPPPFESPPACLPSRVTVEAPARLHLGFIDLNGSLGRCFGSLGVAIDGLATRVCATVDPGIGASGPQADLAEAHARRMMARLQVQGGVHLAVEQALPEHVGLGSGTQLALAVGCAVARLHGRSVSAREIAMTLDRGARSGIGVAAFEQGGFVLDGGRDPHRDAVPPLLSRIGFPAAWRWILVFDDNHRGGLSGAAERQAFGSLPPFPELEAARLSRIVLMQMLPALAEADIERFGHGLTVLQESVGDHFAPAQGGRYASRDVAAALHRLQHAGAAAVGQTSWGPTGFALADSPAQALLLVERARAGAAGDRLRFQIHAARNRGADVAVRVGGPRPPVRASVQRACAEPAS